MRARIQMFLPDQTNPRHQRALFVADQICLFVVVQVALINLLWRAFPNVDRMLPAGLLHMRATSAVAALCAALALFFAEAMLPEQMTRLSRSLAVITVLIAVLQLLAPAPGPFGAIARRVLVEAAPPAHRFLPVTALAFVLLGVAIFFVRSGDDVPGRPADVLTCAMSFVVLILLSEIFFAWAQVPGSSAVGLTSAPALCCVALLTLVTLFRRIEHGAFSIFVGHGIGSRIARILAPVLLVVPFLREIARARLLDAKVMPPHYATAILTSVATVVGFGLLLLLSRLVNRMQTEIQDLTLRDELTGVYSARGFNLLAEQALRMTRRAQAPFGVLFVDMDNLKVINDESGHNVGSAALVEAANLLTANFRETDIIGRVGGDEFVVAGNFDEGEIAEIIDRLRAAAVQKNRAKGRKYSLSLSMGFAVTEHAANETLRSLVGSADKAMYEEKREKKRRVRPVAVVV